MTVVSRAAWGAWELVCDPLLAHVVPGYWAWGAATVTAFELWGLVPGAIVGALLAVASIVGHVFVAPEIRARRRVPAVDPTAAEPLAPVIPLRRRRRAAA